MRAKTEQQFMVALGRQLADVRKAHHVTQEQLAAAADLDRVAIAYIETGKRKPKVSSMYKIACALNIDVETLFKNL